MRHIFCLIMFLMLVWCCHAQDVPAQVDITTVAVTYQVRFHADTAFTLEERQEIRMAADTWRGATGGLADITVDFDLDWNSMLSLKQHQAADLILRTDSTNPLFQEDGKWNHTIGNCQPFGGIHARHDGPIRMHLIVDKLHELNIFRSVVVHEMGHALGLAHVENTKAIMYRFGDTHRGPTCLTKADMTEFCRVNECGHVRTFSCER